MPEPDKTPNTRPTPTSNDESYVDWADPSHPPRSARAADMHGEIVLPVSDLFSTVSRWFWLILLTALGCAALALGYSLMQAPTYQASVMILVGQEGGITADPAQVSNLQALTATLSEAVETRTVAEGAVERLDLRVSPEDVLESTNAEPIEETQFIKVSYTASTPERAQEVANAIGEEFSEQVSEVSPEVSAITATVWEPAATPEVPVNPDPLRDSLLALVLGGVLGIGLAFLLDATGTTAKSSWRGGRPKR